MDTTAAPTDALADTDAGRLQELGYRQELRRALHLLDNSAVGFATISPVVGLYAVAFVAATLVGPAWVWVLPVALAGQSLLLVVYTELAAEFPLTNGAYQWSRRVAGPAYGWFNGWVALCAYAVANTTIAYLAAPWALALVGVEPTPLRVVVTAATVIAVASCVNLLGVQVLRGAVWVGVTTEVLVSVSVGLALLFAFRVQDWSLLFETLGAESSSGGSETASLLAALAVGGWVFIGFDACVGMAEETRRAARSVPVALWTALGTVAAVVIVSAVAITLAHPRPDDIVAGRDVDPITTAVVTSFGRWSTKPFSAGVLVAFLACAIAAQGLTARAIYSAARDGVVPGSRLLRRVDRRGVPSVALALATAIACLGLVLGLESTAIGTLITFGTAGIFASFLLVASAALWGRVRGSWIPAYSRLGRAALAINVLAVVWVAFEAVNVAWPRPSLAPPGAPWYQVWAAPLVLALIAGVGLAYLAVAKPHRRLESPSGRRTGRRAL
jgi:amino acid transporter